MDDRIYEFFYLILNHDGTKLKIYPEAKKFFPHFPDILERKSLTLVDYNAPLKVDVILISLKDIKKIKDLTLSLNPNGKVLFFKSKRDFLSLKKEKVSLFNKFFYIEEYGILPSIKNPRWIIPLVNPKVSASSLNIYQPSLFIPKIVKKLAQVSFLFNGKRYLPLDKFFILSNSPSSFIYNIIKQSFSSSPIYLSLFTGTPGYYRKVCFQIMDEKGDILAYAKLAETPQTKNLTENEAKVLLYLDKLNIKTSAYPKLIFYKDFSRYSLLIQSACPKPFWLRNFSITKNHLLFLEELYRKTSKANQLPFYQLESFVKIQQRVDRILLSIPSEWIERFLNGFEKIRDYIPMALSFSHGDFTPWNTSIKDGKLYIFDWEYATYDDPPLMDLFHFYIQPAVLVKKKPADFIARDVIAKTYIYLNKIFPSLSEDERYRTVVNLLIFYLMKMSSLYLEANILSKQPVTDKRLLKAWGDILDTQLMK